MFSNSQGWGCLQVCDELLGEVAGGCPALRALSCASCQAVTDVGVARLAAVAPELQRLCANDCIRLTDGALRALASSCTNLQARTSRCCCWLPNLEGPPVPACPARSTRVSLHGGILRWSYFVCL